jgi:hypothetical protein
MVVLDFSNAEIAEKLFVNVKSHLASAFSKLESAPATLPLS